MGTIKLGNKLYNKINKVVKGVNITFDYEDYIVTEELDCVLEDDMYYYFFDTDIEENVTLGKIRKAEIISYPCELDKALEEKKEFYLYFIEDYLFNKCIRRAIELKCKQYQIIIDSNTRKIMDYEDENNKYQEKIRILKGGLA